jgi:hypothetical protein
VAVAAKSVRSDREQVPVVLPAWAWEAKKMSTYLRLHTLDLEPETVSRITAAYKQALNTLCVKDRDDPLAEMVAKKIIKIAQTDVRDPVEIAALAIKELELQ